MNFKIYYEGLLVAQFMLKDDRAICLDHLRRIYPKCKFKTKLYSDKKKNKKHSAEERKVK